MHDQVQPIHRGDVWPAAAPGNDPVLYGHVQVNPDRPVEARSLQTFKLVYTCGRFGIDGGGGIKIVFRFTADWGDLQCDDPSELNYVTAVNSRGLEMSIHFADVGHTRPWYQSLQVFMPFGHLAEGDTITVVLGERSGGSPGLKVQSCAEQDFQFRVLVDAVATALYVPVSNTPVVPIVAGEAVSWYAVLPSLRRLGENFRFGIRAEDRWGNPTPKANQKLRLETTLPVRGLPDQIHYSPGREAHVFEGLQVDDAGILRIKVYGDDDSLLATSTPMIVRDDDVAGYWADLHGQSGESVGINTARHYFGFARDVAFLDASGHQANDFQVNKAFWQHLNELTAEFNDEGHFVTYPGYEWSANTHLGGDRNVYFRREGRTIHRSSHALLPDTSDIDTDANDAPSLFAALKNEDAVVFAHVGGRWADLTRGHDARLETAMEIHSAWGTFEWLMNDALEMGFRVGVVANSDGHKGRPGASHPSTSEFAAYGGLTCLLAPALTRDSLFDCLRKRRHFATTGARLHIDVSVNFSDEANCWDKDPSVYEDATSHPVRRVSMGDIVSYSGKNATIEFSIVSHSPIEKVEIRNGVRCVALQRPYAEDELGSRVRVLMSGADRRGKGSRSRWRGQAVVRGADIRRFESVSAWNPEFPFHLLDDHTVEFKARTAGNMTGFDLWLEERGDAELLMDTGNGEARFALARLGYDETRVALGGLQREVRALRLPDKNRYLSFASQCDVQLQPNKDNPIWICVTTEDGHQAWSSPVYVVAP